MDEYLPKGDGRDNPSPLPCASAIQQSRIGIFGAFIVIMT